MKAASAVPIMVDLHVRGTVPRTLSGSLLVAANRRHKDHARFSRWHDSQADLIRIDLRPGTRRPVRAHILPVDSSGTDVGTTSAHGYVTQPNHGLNIGEGRIWATNLLFGVPLEVDLERWRARRALRYLEPSDDCPQLSTTAHFAWSLDRRYAYFHQSLLRCESKQHDVRAQDLRLVRLDTQTGEERVWSLTPPADDAQLEAANFHSAFYFEEGGKQYVGLLRTGAWLEELRAHADPGEHSVRPMPNSTIWIVPISDRHDDLQAELLPGIDHIPGLALSHLDVDARGGNGFTLFANYKQADVAEETHGVNLYREPSTRVEEHYSGMTVEAINYGYVIRYERRDGQVNLRQFSRPYDPANTSLGHSWLPINIELDPRGSYLFCSFSGFRPRLLPRHIANAYPGRHVDPKSIRYVPPLLLRMRADTLEVDYQKDRRHLSYAEPIAMTVADGGHASYVCTYSSEAGLRIYDAEDLSRMVCHAVAPDLMTWGDSYFRPDPAHMKFVAH
jgi:hypothetical protein